MPSSALNPAESPKPAVIIHAHGHVAKNVSSSVRSNSLILPSCVTTCGRAWSVTRYRTFRKSAAKKQSNEMSQDASIRSTFPAVWTWRRRISHAAPSVERFFLVDTLACASAKIAMSGLTTKSSSATMALVKINAAGLTATAHIDARARVTAKSLVHCVKPPVKCNAGTPGATKNAKNPAHRVLKIARGHAHTVAAARCPAQCPAIFFHVPKDVEKRSAAATSVHRFAAKSVLLRNIVKSALRNLSKVPWWITSCKPRMVTSNSTKIPSLCRHVTISWHFRAWTGTWECLSTTSCPLAFPLRP